MVPQLMGGDNVIYMVPRKGGEIHTKVPQVIGGSHKKSNNGIHVALTHTPKKQQQWNRKQGQSKVAGHWQYSIGHGLSSIAGWVGVCVGVWVCSG